MTDLNNVTIIGRLTKDIDLSYTNGGFAIGKLSIAVNRSVKKGDQWTEEASFFDVKLLGKSAENLAKYLLKGKQIAVSGELVQDRWEKDGVKQSRVVILAQKIQLVGGQSGNGEKQAYQPQQSYHPQQAYNPQGSYEAENFSDDIPF